MISRDEVKAVIEEFLSNNEEFISKTVEDVNAGLLDYHQNTLDAIDSATYTREIRDTLFVYLQEPLVNKIREEGVDTYDGFVIIMYVAFNGAIDLYLNNDDVDSLFYQYIAYVIKIADFLGIVYEKILLTFKIDALKKLTEDELHEVLKVTLIASIMDKKFLFFNVLLGSIDEKSINLNGSSLELMSIAMYVQKNVLDSKLNIMESKPIFTIKDVSKESLENLLYYVALLDMYSQEVNGQTNMFHALDSGINAMYEDVNMYYEDLNNLFDTIESNGKKIYLIKDYGLYFMIIIEEGQLDYIVYDFNKLDDEHLSLFYESVMKNRNTYKVIDVLESYNFKERVSTDNLLAEFEGLMLTLLKKPGYISSTMCYKNDLSFILKDDINKLKDKSKNYMNYIFKIEDYNCKNNDMFKINHESMLNFLLENKEYINKSHPLLDFISEDVKFLRTIM